MALSYEKRHQSILGLSGHSSGGAFESFLLLESDTGDGTDRLLLESDTGTGIDALKLEDSQL